MLALQRCGLGSDERCVGREGKEGAVNKLRCLLVYDCHTYCSQRGTHTAERKN